MKTKLILLLLAAVSFTVAGCKPNNSTDPEEPNIPAGIVVSQEQSFMAEKLSANGKWAAGSSVSLDIPAVWDVENNRVSVYEGFDGGAFHAVNNDGVAVGDDGDFAIILKDGAVSKLFAEAGEAGSSAYGITQDGATIVGFYFDAAWQTKPCIWDAAGNRTVLPVPSSAEAGYDVSGAEARWVTPDGSVILGFLFDNFSTWPAVIWRKNGAEYVCDIISKNFFEDDMGKGKPYMIFGSDAMALSDNGEWVTLATQVEYDPMNWDVPVPVILGARLNLNTMKLEVAEDVNAFFGVANDGTAVGFSTDENTGNRVGYFWKANEEKPANFTATFTYDEIAGASLSPCYISADTKTVLGWAVSSTDIFSFVIHQ